MSGKPISWGWAWMNLNKREYNISTGKRIRLQTPAHMHRVTWKFLLIEILKEGQSNEHRSHLVTRACSHNPQSILLARLFALCDTGSHCPCTPAVVNVVRTPKCAPGQGTRLRWQPSPVPLLLHLGVWHRNLNSSHQAAHEANGKSLTLISKSPFLFQLWKNYFNCLFLQGYLR